MKSLKKLLLAKSILAAAVAASGIAAPTVSHAATVAGGPFAGMVCRTGYTAAFDGTRLKCSKASSFELPLVCLNSNFPAYTIRFGTGNNDDRDLCTRTVGAISINQSLNGLVESTNGTSGNYVFATFDPVAVAAKTLAQDAAEAAALSLTVGEVDTLQGTPLVRANGRAGGKGEVNVPLTFFAFPVPGSGIVIGNPGPIGLPGTVTSATPFVPKAIPR
jgi:hypothetical protein